MNTREGAPKVVIVGGGFAGLYAARGLAHAPASVTLIDKHNYHLFRPMTYQVATGLLSADEIAAPLRSIFRKQQNVDVLMAEVTGVDPANKMVHLQRSSLPYDFLILATGIHYNYFGHQEWEQIAPGLDSIDDADRIRGKIISAFEAAENLAATGQADASTLKELLTFVIVGGGTAGVEMAGTLAEMSRMALQGDFRHIDPRATRVLLFEALPRILPSYPEELSAQAHRHLEQLGVQIHTSSHVESVDLSGVMAAGQHFPSRTVLWSAGVVASPAGRWLGAETDNSGRVKVNPDFSVPAHPEIFVIGDTALVIAEARNLLGIKRKKPERLPGVAQPAIQEGKYVADLIQRRIKARPAPKPFWYWDKGNLAIVGRTFAVADLGFVRFSGFPAWMLWAGVHVYFLIDFANRVFVSIRWAMAFLTNRRSVRIFPSQFQSVEAVNALDGEPVPRESPGGGKAA